MANVIDLTKVTYSVVALLSNGEQVQLDKVAENIAWEENEKELATRLNLTVRDVPVKGGQLSKQLALCTIVYLYADWGTGSKEIFRGTIWEWTHSEMNGDSIILTCYDMLYYLQKSKDNIYYAKGKTTKTLVEAILKKWQVMPGEYTATDFTHKKILAKNKTISQILTDILEEDEDKGGEPALIRAREGKADIIARGSNTEVWGFSASSNISTSQDKYSMTSLVTRVVVTGKEDKKGRPKVSATLDGQTEYGILQEFKAEGSTSLKDAKKAAQKILKENGKPKRTITVQSPDFPPIRKGDQVFITTDKMEGYFFVNGVSHNATQMTMRMEVEPFEQG